MPDVSQRVGHTVIIISDELDMELTSYLKRIHYDGSLAVNIDTLTSLHRAHLYAIPYENFDIHLGGYLRLDEDHIFKKLVIAGRGGWCYEMNGLFAWALRELGFPVKMLSSAVNRQVNGNKADRTHLILTVELDQPYLVDVGFGNGLLEPLPLVEGTYEQGFLNYHLTHDGEYWRFQNHAYGGPGFDFTLQPHQFSDFADKCHELQTSPESGFVRVTVCHRFTPHGIVTLRGTVLQTITRQGVGEEVIESQDAYQQILHEQFDLDIPGIGLLWPKVWERHLQWADSK